MVNDVLAELKKKLQAIYSNFIYIIKMIEQSYGSWQLTGLISKRKYIILMLMDPKSSQYKRLKYIEVNTQTERMFYEHSLLKIDYSLNKNNKKINGNIDYGFITKQPDKKFVFASDQFIHGENLEKILSSQVHQKGALNGLISNLIHNLPFILIDKFIELIELNTIVNQSNLFVFSNQLIVNKISFTGMDIIFFEKSISYQEFRSIFNFLNSNIFENAPCDRINHLTKIKNFAALFLTFLINRPIKLLENQKLPEMITPEYAKSLLKKSPQLYSKFLKTKKIAAIIDKYSTFWGINLGSFFDEVLAKQKYKSWCDIHSLFCKNTTINRDFSYLTQSVLNNCWNQLNSYQKNYLYLKGIISKEKASEVLTMKESSLLLIISMDLKVASLKNGALLQVLEGRPQFNLLTVQLMTKFIDLCLKNPSKKQSGEVHIADFHQRNLEFAQKEIGERDYVIDIYSNQTCITEEKNQQKQSEEQQIEYIHQRNLEQADKEACRREQIMTIKLNQNYSLEERQQNQRNANHAQSMQNQVFHYDETVLQLYKTKMVKQLEVQDKIVKIEHQRLKSLRTFESAFR